jgi:hypothetical protein
MAEKRLFMVEITGEIIVLAENAREAEMWVDSNHYDWRDDAEFGYSATEAKENSLPTEWRGYSEPYNSDGRTCEQVLGIDAESLARKREEAQQQAEWDAHPKLLEI